VIVENQVNTGENCLKVIEAIRNNGCKVLGIVTIFDYEFESAHQKLREADVDLTSLTNLEAVLRHAQAMNIIDEQQKQTINEWQKNPAEYMNK
jgi:orotate phosphoribosyltransferase